ncbi:hypothetical protein, partial [Mesorhizobium sp.]|uniref:hypothetical protein n=1 Tax=Mesorhizobium sp. TaxID=1871066 RepID=UPI00257A7B61
SGDVEHHQPAMTALSQRIAELSAHYRLSLPGGARVQITRGISGDQQSQRIDDTIVLSNRRDSSCILYCIPMD